MKHRIYFNRRFHCTSYPKLYSTECMVPVYASTFRPEYFCYSLNNKLQRHKDPSTSLENIHTYYVLAVHYYNFLQHLNLNSIH